MDILKPKTIMVGLAAAALALATVSTLATFSEALGGFWQNVIWMSIPQPLRILLANTAVWWMILVLLFGIALLGRKIHATAKDGLQGGAPLVLGALGGGGRATWRKLSSRLPAMLRNSIQLVGVFPDDRRTEATEPLASRFLPGADYVEVPPGQSNLQAALAAHENYATTYKPVLRRGIDRAARALMVLHQGGYTGAVAAIYACEELAASPKETVFLVMGDSPDSLVAAIHDPYLYEKARQARLHEAEAKYAWTRGKPDVVEVTA